MNVRTPIPCFLLATLMLACGPTIEPPDQAGDSTSNDSATTASSSPPSTATTGVTPPPGTTTTATTASTFSTIDTGDTDDESSDGFSFIRDPDGGNCYVSWGFWHCSKCDLFAQDCPAGEKCMPWANDGSDDWNDTRCSPIDEDPGQPGDPCLVEGSAVSGIDTCDLGAQCLGVDPQTLEGTCVAMCTGDQSNTLCRDPQTACLVSNEGAIILCLPRCNPLVSDCGPAEICVPAEDAFVCMPAAPGAGAGGMSCEFLYDCQPGLACVDSQAVGAPCDQGAVGCCTPLCDLSAPDPTAGCLDPGQVCEPWWVESPPSGLEDVGACALPAP